MLRNLISAALRRETPDEIPSPQATEPMEEAVPDLDFPPMVPLHPPEARNDNPLAAYCEAVEEDLRAAGYLR